MKKLKHEYCCDLMNYHLDFKLQRESEFIEYQAETRDYQLILHGSWYGSHLSLLFCPWCGAKLPKELGEEWRVIIKEKFGLNNVYREEFESLPEEFRTDQWWKKRGL